MPENLLSLSAPALKLPSYIAANSTNDAFMNSDHLSRTPESLYLSTRYAITQAITLAVVYTGPSLLYHVACTRVYNSRQ